MHRIDEHALCRIYVVYGKPQLVQGTLGPPARPTCKLIPFFTQYPEYRDYQTLVGEFAPQSTVWKGLWARVTGLRPRLAEVVWGQETDETGAGKEKK
jgi:hypothetical protein